MRVRRLGTWVSLRSIGNSYAVRLTILIPLIGYVILFNEKLVEWSRLLTEVGGDKTGISFRLLCIYFGLVFVGMGSTLYSVFCPDRVKRYPRASDYISEAYDSMNAREFNAIRQIVERSLPLDKALVDIGNRLDTLRNDLGSDIRDLHDYREFRTTILDLYYKLLNERRPTIRIVCSILFGIGFVFLIIPSVSVFIRVCLIALGVRH